jgi:four helix bundle protein
MKGIWKFEDLIAWQLAFELKLLVDGICNRPVIRSDFKFCSQLCDAAASGPRNLAEGFGRHFHPEFARFARIAKASELEVLNHLMDARSLEYITGDEFDHADHLVRRALKVVNGLIRHLESTPGYGRKPG